MTIGIIIGFVLGALGGVFTTALIAAGKLADARIEVIKNGVET